MGYVSHSIFITEHKFVIEIKKAKQMQDFEILYNLANLKPM